MPELAEVETVRKNLDQFLRGQIIKEVAVDATDKFLYAFAGAKKVQKALAGAKITGSGRVGKYFWLELDKKPWPIFHLGMTGSVTIFFPGKKISKKKVWEGLKLQSKQDQSSPVRLWFCRFLIKMQNGTEVALIDPRRFGRIWLSDDPSNHPRIKKLGFDPLVKFPTANELHKRISKRRLAIKTVLLDQKLFAGIGNYLADEILFQTKMSPHRSGSELSLKDVTNLRKNIIAIIKKAVALDANYELFPKTWLFHHRWGKSKTAKVSTGQKIIHDEISGRTTAWVPTIQK
ncbi:MAG: hypothetical protein H7328_03735 [Bdellovibrio sp.]|nr:hypothetical protein [Bdellovibrio sp.]